MSEPRFSMLELVESSGMPERTIRYYIEKRLIPPARGKGRSAYYTTDHLRRIEQIRDYQGQGLSLDEIASQLRSANLPQDDAEAWNRLTLHDDLEIQVRQGAPEAVQILVRRFQEMAGEWFGTDGSKCER